MSITMDGAPKNTVRPVQVKPKNESPGDVPYRSINANTILKKIFRYIGLSIPQQHRRAYIVYSIVLNSLVSIGFPLSFGLSYLRLFHLGWEEVELELLLNSLQMFINLFALYAKLFTLTLLQRKWFFADELIERLDRRCYQTQSPEEIEELRLCVRHGNLCTIIYFVAYWTYVVSNVFGAVFRHQTPYDLYLPFVYWRRSPTQFVISAFIEFLMVSVGSVQQTFNDSFVTNYVNILRTHMKILLLRFSRLGKDSSMSSSENFNELKQCIRDHKTYLELYDIIASIISITIFLQFVVTALILSTTMVNFMLIATDFYSRIGSFFYIIAVVLEILPVCYFAQCLMDDSNRMSEVIFHSNWVDQDSRYRKMLVFFMQKTQCSKMLTAGKLFPINLSCCLSIVKFSFTLFTFIGTMDLKEKFDSL